LAWFVACLIFSFIHAGFVGASRRAMSVRLRVNGSARKPSISVSAAAPWFCWQKPAAAKRRQSTPMQRTQNMKTTVSPNYDSESNGRGRGLVSMASAFASAGGDVFKTNIDCETIAQAAKDTQMIEAQAWRLNRCMVDKSGRQSEWISDRDGGGWSAAMSDAMADAWLAVLLWRQKSAMRRDTASGEDVITAADKKLLRQPANRVAWDAMLKSLQSDGFGESESNSLAAWDWAAWYYGDKAEGETPAQKQARRDAAAAAVWDQIAQAGDGRRVWGMSLVSAKRVTGCGANLPKKD